MIFVTNEAKLKAVDVIDIVILMIFFFQFGSGKLDRPNIKGG